MCGWNRIEKHLQSRYLEEINTLTKLGSDVKKDLNCSTEYLSKYGDAKTDLSAS